MSNSIPKQLTLGIRLDAGRTFENFSMGRNQPTLSTLAAGLRGELDSPVYLWGSAGCGKTHLLEACCAGAYANHASVAFIPLREMSTIQSSILDGLADYDVVCIDDVHLVAGQAPWEEALFHFYNRAFARHTTVVFASALQVTRVSFNLPDLRSRLVDTLTLQVFTLTDEERGAALQVRAHERGFELTDEVVQFVLHRMPRDMHSLFALLDKLDDSTLEQQRKVTVPLVRALMT